MSSSGGHPRDLLRGAIHAMAQGLQDFQRFFDGRYALCRLQQAVIPQTYHPLTLGNTADLAGRGPQQYHLSDLVGNHHHLEDPVPSLVATPAAPAAAYSLVEMQAFRG